jgi:signal transduction histidine kinase/ABC-type phosphate/phosphonate transport system substrate-binding protein
MRRSEKHSAADAVTAAAAAVGIEGVSQAIIGKSVMILLSITVALRSRRFFSGRQAHLAVFLLGVTWIFIASPLAAHEIYRKVPVPRSGLPILIGALANRGTEECLRRWKPTAAYLERHLPGTRFRIVPLGFNEVADRVASGRVNFIITNPAQYSVLEFTGKAYRIAGILVPSVSGPQRMYGGVIFTRSDRLGIRNISDLKGRTFSAVDSESLGGWLCARRELHAAHIDPFRDFADLRFAGTHDALIQNVLSGSSDAGTIRSSQFEKMAAEGKIDLRNFRVLPGPSFTSTSYPFLVSTRLYPEWPLAVVKGTDEDLSREVAVALMTMGDEDPAAKASGGCGWTIPADYSDVHELLRELHLGPYKDLGRVTPGLLFSLYWPHLLAAAGAISLISLFAVKSWMLNRRLQGSMEELSQRTIALNASKEQLQQTNRELSREIEARTVAEEASGRSVSLLRATLESTADGILVVDRAGRIVDYNQRFLDLWHIPDDVIALHNDETALAYVQDQLNNPGEFIAKVMNLYNLPEEESFDTLYFRDGRIFERYSRPQRVGSRVTGRVWSFREVTELKNIEAERLEMERRLLHSQKLESLGVLAGGIAHDFNNLLTVILGNLDLVRLKATPDSQAQHNIEDALKACHRAAKLISQMLDYAGKGQFTLRTIDLNDVVHESAALLRTSVARNIELTIATTPVLAKINADQGHIQQVIMNLIINAAEAMGAGHGVITIGTGMLDCDDRYLSRSRIEEKPASGRFIYLEVSDTGCGMDEETQSRLFEPFYTTKFMGRGLGMSAVQGIVRAHGGAIMLDSEAGRGTVFRVLFPAIEKALIPLPEIAGSADQPEMRCADRGKILVVDDEQDVRGLCMAIVEYLGFQPIGAADGNEALKIFSEHASEIKLVILDMTMPNMDGVSAFHGLRRIRSDVEVIISSGYSEKDVSCNFTGDRPSGLIQKPFKVEELQGRILRIMYNKFSSQIDRRPPAMTGNIAVSDDNPGPGLSDFLFSSPGA